MKLALSALMLAAFVVPSVARAQLVGFGTAGNFLALDLRTNPDDDGRFLRGNFTGAVGWAATNGKEFRLESAATLNGNLYSATGSSVRIDGSLNGTHFSNQNMSGFLADASSANTQFQGLAANQTFGTVTGGTIARSGVNTVVNITNLNLSNSGLTISGNAGDYFYLRVTGSFNLSNSNITLSGTDASHVFFYYSSSSDLNVTGGNIQGQFFAPNSTVLMSSLSSFSGAVIAGEGFRLEGASSSTAFNFVAPVPEPEAGALVAGLGAAAWACWRRRTAAKAA